MATRRPLVVVNGVTSELPSGDTTPTNSVAPGTARQLLQTNAGGTATEWTSNVDVPGTLDVTSTATFDSIAQYPAGSASAPTITFTGDTNTGIYSPGADQVAISTAGSGRLFVNSDGTVSVGNALTPTGITSLGLRVSTNTGVGNVLVLSKSSDGTNPPNLTFCKSRGTAASPTAVTVNDVAGSVFGTAYDGSTHQSVAGLQYVVESLAGSNDISGNIQFQTRSSGVGAFTQERLRITSAGLVGVGTSTPVNALDVNGGIGVLYGDGLRIFRNQQTVNNTLLAHTFTGGNDQLNIAPGGNSATSAIAFQTATGSALGTRMFISPTGLVGIGTTSPGFPLQIGATGSPGVAIDSANSGIHGTFGSGGGLVLRAQLAATAGGGQIFLGGSTRGDGDLNAIVFSNANSERARIDSSGRLLVGTSSVGGYRVSSTSYNPQAEIKGSFSSPSWGGSLAIVSTNQAGNLWLVNDTTNPASGDNLGVISFNGYDGTNRNQGASIAAQVDGTSGTGDLPSRLVFSTTADGASSPTERMRIQNDGNVIIGKAGQTSSYVNPGISLFSNGSADFTRASAYLISVNRQTDDGVLVEFYQDNWLEGTISVSGTTVSYNGAHLSRWSQLPSGIERTEILRGTVLSNIDEMCEWGDEDNEQLNRMKVSDVEGDKNVSGVFQAWDDDDDTYTNDFYCAMTGDFIIRIGAGVTVERGDLLMSAGDGTAKPQDDDIIRSKTIAKITSTNVSCTYDDGSYCVPCVLMAC